MVVHIVQKRRQENDFTWKGHKDEHDAPKRQVSIASCRFIHAGLQLVCSSACRRLCFDERNFKVRSPSFTISICQRASLNQFAAKRCTYFQRQTDTTTIQQFRCKIFFPNVECHLLATRVKHLRFASPAPMQQHVRLARGFMSQRMWYPTNNHHSCCQKLI